MAIPITDLQTHSFLDYDDQADLRETVELQQFLNYFLYFEQIKIDTNPRQLYESLKAIYVSVSLLMNSQLTPSKLDSSTEELEFDSMSIRTNYWSGLNYPSIEKRENEILKREYLRSTRFSYQLQQSALITLARCLKAKHKWRRIV